MKTDELLNQTKQNKSESSISSADKDFETEETAQRVFSALKTKLLNINEWNDHALMSSYELFDENGNSVDKRRNCRRFIYQNFAQSVGQI